MKVTFSKQVSGALNRGSPVLALESTIISSGMPYPENISFHSAAEKICCDHGVVPATIAIIRGEICVGLNKGQLKHIANNKRVVKISKREVGLCVQKKMSGATTVSSASHIAHHAGIRVFSTGGIGGIHRNYQNTHDMSQDLFSLKETPIIIVSSGVKSFLNVEKTVEALETFGVPLVGFKTAFFPLFYSSESKIKIPFSVNKVNEIIDIYKSYVTNNINSSLLVLNPVEKKDQIPIKTINKIINSAILKMNKNYVSGKQATPFLLNEILKQTKGQSLKTNMSLALGNIKLGAKIARGL